ncbi:MAG: NAD(P)H-dependent oxidoreductase [bacterium]
MKKILVINAHPKADSFCTALADKYTEGAKKSGNEVKTLNLKDLNLEPFLKFEYKDNPILTPDLLQARELIAWSDHLVFVYPNWWAMPPALLKVFFEIVFGSGFAFKYKDSKGGPPQWDRLLPNKSSRIIVTMDSPTWYYNWLVGDPGFKMMKTNLQFCGITPVTKNYFGSVKGASDEQRKKWLEEAYAIGGKE